MWPKTGAIKNFRPYQHVGNFGLLVFICEIIIFIGFIIFMIKMIISIKKQGRKFFKEFWNITDLIIVILFFCGFIMYMGRSIMINKSMDKFPIKMIISHIKTRSPKLPTC
jgi:NADH:ubiquinone oxidoreductase subunit 6 (subunit J)